MGINPSVNVLNVWFRASVLVPLGLRQTIKTNEKHALIWLLFSLMSSPIHFKYSLREMDLFEPTEREKVSALHQGLRSSIMTTSHRGAFPPLLAFGLDIPADTSWLQLRRKLPRVGEPALFYHLPCSLLWGNARRKHIWIQMCPRLLVLGCVRCRCSPAVKRRWSSHLCNCI